MRFFRLKIDNIERFAAFAAHVSAAVGILLILLQFYADSNLRKREHSLRMIEQFDEDNLSTHRGALDRSWLEIGSVVSEINKGPGISAAEKDQLIEFALSKFDEKHKTTVDLSIIEIVRFFDRVNVCIETSVCEKGILDEALQPYARDFYETYGKRIRTLRGIGYADLGANMEKFIKN
jgi:hypothetical protein